MESRVVAEPMDPSPSSALGLPEMVCLVLHHLDRCMASLYSCLFVNRLFSLEATRIVWHTCGSGLSGSILAGRQPQQPLVQHLAVLVDRDPHRAQHYANFIHVLIFDQFSPSDEGEQLRGHLLLKRLRFPRLKTLTLSIHPRCNWRVASDEILCYAHPGLEKCSIFNVEDFPDGFVEKLVTQSPRMRKLLIALTKWRRQTQDLPLEPIEAQLIQLVKNLPHLSHFSLYGNFSDKTAGYGWSFGLLEALAAHPSLVTADIPTFEGYWVPMLISNASLTFPKLKQLTTGLPNTSLELLLPYVPNLTHLYLDLTSFPLVELQQPSLLPLLSKCTNITDLTIRFPEHHQILGRDFVALAKGCHNVQVLKIWGPIGKYPVGDEFGDSTMDEAAKCLPKLQSIVLRLCETAQTYKSFLSLCRHCKYLYECHIPAIIDFKVLVQDEEEESNSLVVPSVYPQLTTVSFDFHGPSGCEDGDPTRIAEQFRRMFPNVRKLFLPGAGTFERAFYYEFRRLLPNSHVWGGPPHG